MNEVPSKYLPLGTVVILKNAKKRVMITGFCSIDNANVEKLWDYAGCMYPEGFLSSNQTCLFNHEQIDKVFHMGFVDDEEKAFKEKMTEMLNTLNGKTTKKEETDSNPVEIL